MIHVTGSEFVAPLQQPGSGRRRLAATSSMFG